MKALSLTQPWASLVAHGHKRIETRSWNPYHRGAIAIHAAKAFPTDCRELCGEEPFRSALWDAGCRMVQRRATGLTDLPLGAIVAVATLLDAVWCGRPLLGQPEDWSDLPHERAFGRYSPGRYMLVLSNVRRLVEPVPCRGALGVWDVPEAVAEEVRRRVTPGHTP